LLFEIGHGLRIFPQPFFMRYLEATNPGCPCWLGYLITPVQAVSNVVEQDVVEHVVAPGA
ncbi:hypothetical protein OAG51_02485, partial [Pirellulaceae bacterium]|nr:hypothetical protein [Pirellulaceae bacterium]